MSHQKGIVLSDSDADCSFAGLHPEEGKLSNEELINVAGEACD